MEETSKKPDLNPGFESASLWIIGCDANPYENGGDTIQKNTLVMNDFCRFLFITTKRFGLSNGYAFNLFVLCFK